MLRLENISRTVGNFAISNATFSAGKGEYVVILGPTGCGKTVLLETIAGIGRADEGKIFIAGEDVTHRPPEKRNIGFVYQRSMLFPHYTVAKNISYGMRIRKLPAAEQRRRMENLAEMLGIEHLLEREVGNLSGGESQKVALARALAIEPPILLLDEPLAPLDPGSRENLRKELLQMHRQLSTAIVHVTHDQLTARVLADKIGVMQDGFLRQFGTAEDVFHRPDSEFVARFVGMENVYRGRASAGEGGCEVKVGGIALKTASTLAGHVGLCISPEVIHVVKHNETTCANMLTGMVRDVSDRGAMFKIIIDVAGLPFTVHSSRHEYEHNPVAAGTEATIGFDPEDVHCFKVDEA